MTELESVCVQSVQHVLERSMPSEFGIKCCCCVQCYYIYWEKTQCDCNPSSVT